MNRSFLVFAIRPRPLLISIVALFLLIHLTVGAQSRPGGWRDETHGRDAVPDYDRVFAASEVGRLEITITAANWSTVIADMTDMAGPFGAQRVSAPTGGFGGFAPPSADATASCGGKLIGDACAFGGTPNGRCIPQGNTDALACVAIMGDVGNAPPRGGGPNAQGGNAQGADDVDIFPRTPVYVPADLSFDGVPFRRVGFRLKGNSSLSNAWRAGVDKLPFRLNIDALEDDFPEIRDQTFFGFPNLSFTNNGTDTSFLKQRVVTDLFRQAGVPAARTAFIRVYLDRGAGLQDFGLYTMTEVPDRPMLEGTFGSDEGNLYKPVGSGGRWTQFFQVSFPKKTNEADEDWTDVQGAMAALNADRSSASVWRSRLEARFEVNGFLRWLALNTIVGNTDAYGGLSAHNYYLYGSPRHRDRLFWIAWDHDLAMQGGVGGGGGGGGPRGGGPAVGGAFPGAGGAPNAGAPDLFLDNTNATWPLIRFLLDDPVYRATYRGHVVDLLNTVFEPTRLSARLRAEQALITPYVTGPEGEQAGRTFLSNGSAFTTSVDSLVAYVQSRSASLRQALEMSR